MVQEVSTKLQDLTEENKTVHNRFNDVSLKYENLKKQSEDYIERMENYKEGFEKYAINQSILDSIEVKTSSILNQIMNV